VAPTSRYEFIFAKPLEKNVFQPWKKLRSGKFADFMLRDIATSKTLMGSGSKETNKPAGLVREYPRKSVVSPGFPSFGILFSWATNRLYA